MAKISVYNLDGKAVEDITLSDRIYDVDADINLIEQAIRIHLANRRHSVASTKDRSEVRGGGRKPWRQKGTGRARHGSIRSPLWSGGGVTFGPRPERNWSLKLNKKAARKTLYMALTDKVRNNTFLVLENLDLKEPKTSVLSAQLKKMFTALDKEYGKILLVLPHGHSEIHQLARNLPEIELIAADSLNTYDVVKHTNLLVLKSALPVIEETYSEAKVEKVN